MEATDNLEEYRNKPATGSIALPIARYRFIFAAGEGRLPKFAGSAWRGAFGRALKRTVCVTRLPHCPECLLYRGCVYPYIFETPPPLNSTKMRRYTAAPHPFVIETPLPAVKTDEQRVDELGVCLVGHANRYLPYIVYALRRAGEGGISKDRVPHDLVKVEQAADLLSNWRPIHRPEGPLDALPPTVPDIPAMPVRIRIHLLTPLRIRLNGSLINADEFSFARFFNVLLRRISMLTYFHTDTPLEADFRGLVEASRAVPVLAADLHWYDWTRYSARQKTTMQMGGLIGEFEIPAEGLAPFWPYLWIGQWTHNGKGASMGLGRYVIDTASLPDQTGETC